MKPKMMPGIALALSLALVPNLAMAQMPLASPAAAPVAPTLPMPAEKPELHYLAAADLLPQRVLALPPVRASDIEFDELAALHAMIGQASPERLAQAAKDDKLENPSIFNDALARDLTKLPQTWALLITVQDEAGAAINIAKEAFGRERPYGIDETLPTCVPVDRTKAQRSYPSGHAGMGYSVAWVLARLMPQMAHVVLARAQDYAQSRQLCGMHFPSDTEASHVLGTLVAERLLADPRLATRIAAAKAELAAN